MPGLELEYFAGQISPWQIPVVDALIWLTPALMVPGTQSLRKLGDILDDERKRFAQMVKLTLSKIDR